MTLHRPTYVRALHSAAEFVERGGLFRTSFDQQRLLEDARLLAGVAEPQGPDDYLEPLGLMLDDYRHRAQLNVLGRLSWRLYLVRLLANRLRTFAAPEPPTVIAPIFILGLPRTGSTLLHELLALHPALRAPTLTDAMTVTGHFGGRALARGYVGGLDLLAPRFKAIHRLGVRLPHECVSIQAQVLRSMQFHAAHRLPSYNEWLQSCDWAPAYAFHARYLGVLQGAQPTRWVLKAPGHMMGLRALAAQYPSAKLVQLHRAPAEVIPSMASLSATLRQAFSDDVDMAEIGRDVLDQWQRALLGTQAARAADPSLNERVLDMDYKTLVSEPQAAVADIAKFVGLEMTDEYRRAIDVYLAANPQGRYGRHRYTPEDFGLTSSEIADRF